MTELPCLTFDVIYAGQWLGVCLQVSDQQWAGAGSRQHWGGNCDLSQVPTRWPPGTAWGLNGSIYMMSEHHRQVFL